MDDSEWNTLEETIVGAHYISHTGTYRKVSRRDIDNEREKEKGALAGHYHLLFGDNRLEEKIKGIEPVLKREGKIISRAVKRIKTEKNIICLNVEPENKRRRIIYDLAMIAASEFERETTAVVMFPDILFYRKIIEDWHGKTIRPYGLNHFKLETSENIPYFNNRILLFGEKEYPVIGVQFIYRI